ncbi:MAG: hypothetical protein PHU85_20385, partial [Phycisphaerae bacterium]|nr:hypothetical protein [Phycisphaerae bacterium]
FGKAAWWTVVAFAFLPLPVDVIRLLAITFKYPRWRFAVACFVGRLARYAIMAYAIAFSRPATQWWLVVGVAVVTIGAGLTIGLPKLVRMVRGQHR